MSSVPTPYAHASSGATLWCAARGACFASRGDLMVGGTELICGQRLANRRLDACVFLGETRVPATAPGSAETEEDSK